MLLKKFSGIFVIENVFPGNMSR